MNDTVQRLRTELHMVLDGLLPEPGQPFALLDFPDYDNIGDSAIYLGNLEFFSSRGLRPTVVGTNQFKDWVDLETKIGNGPIFIQGGGNFGDIWPWFQPFREEILRRYPDRQVVQLPQTIHFESPDAIKKTASVISAHRNFTLLVRDQRSYDFARQHFQCDTRLCPDMAFAIESIRRYKPYRQLLLHLRTDVEASASYDTSAVTGSEIIRADWPRERFKFRQRVKAAAWIGGLVSGDIFDKHKRRERLFRALARARLKRGVKLLSSTRFVLTDRLHGHILCVILGIRHAVLDNNYGKNSGFMDKWGTANRIADRVANLDEGLAALQKAGLRLKAHSEDPT